MIVCQIRYYVLVNLFRFLMEIYAVLSSTLIKLTVLGLSTIVIHGEYHQNPFFETMSSIGTKDTVIYNKPEKYTLLTPC